MQNRDLHTLLYNQLLVLIPPQQSQKELDLILLIVQLIIPKIPLNKIAAKRH